eukprot:5366527-Pleurochrysis_carterae.AAC.1
MPLVRLPVHVASDSIVWYIPGSISRNERIALDASWIGPPKLRAREEQRARESKLRGNVGWG